jgi:hypothetical protein
MAANFILTSYVCEITFFLSVNHVSGLCLTLYVYVRLHKGFCKSFYLLS